MTYPPVAGDTTEVAPEEYEGGKLTRRTLLQSGAAAAAALTLPGLARGSGLGGTLLKHANSSRIVAGGTLLAAIGSEPDTLNPAKSEGSSAFYVFSLVHSNLVGINAAGQPVPRLAKSWAAHDPRTWIFELDPHAKFQNGAPVTASDVKFSIEYFTNPKTASPWAGGLQSIRSVEVDGPRRFVLHLSQPYAPLFTILGRNAQILHQDSVVHGNPGRQPIGAGPFEFVEWVPGSHITLRKFHDFLFPTQPHVNEVTFSFIPVTPASVQDLRSGVINYLQSIPTQQVSSVKADPTFKFWTSGAAGKPEMLCFNCAKPPVDNKLVRQAIAWSIDRNEIHKVGFFGSGQPGSEEVGSKSFWYDGIDPYKAGPSREKARALLSKSGIKLPISVTYLATTEEPVDATIGQLMQQWLRPIGIDLTVNVQQPAPWLNQLLAKDYQIAQIYNETVSDPDQQYTTYLGPGAGNLFNYSDPGFNRARLAARAEVNPHLRKKLYTKVRKYIYDDVPVFYDHYDTDTYLTSNDVTGVEVIPTGYLALETVGFTKQHA